MPGETPDKVPGGEGESKTESHQVETTDILHLDDDSGDHLPESTGNANGRCRAEQRRNLEDHSLESVSSG